MKTLLCLAFAGAVGLRAQQYSLRGAFTFGGSGNSSGGSYLVRGTAGQHGAGNLLTGGTYAVVGGFWALPVAVQTEGAPVLSIAAGTPGSLVVSWAPATPGFVLQQATTLNPPDWANTPGGSVSPTVVPAASPARFYRLQKP